MKSRYNNILKILISMQENVKATHDHCKFCFQVLDAKLRGQKVPEFPKQLPDYKVPIFVTWLLDGDLRGCIGTFQPQKLSKLLGKYALISALNDDRFDPVQIQEMPKLSVGVSFLVNFKSDLGAYDWQIGKNGIILTLKRNNREYQATFLPEVAEQQKWDKKTTLTYLLQKSGCKVPLDLVQKDIKITSYESSKAQLTYKQWKQAKQEKKK